MKALITLSFVIPIVLVGGFLLAARPLIIGGEVLSKIFSSTESLSLFFRVSSPASVGSPTSGP